MVVGSASHAILLFNNKEKVHQRVTPSTSYVGCQWWFFVFPEQSSSSVVVGFNYGSRLIKILMLL